MHSHSAVEQNPLNGVGVVVLHKGEQGEDGGERPTGDFHVR
jgi:hypothetical protein